MKINKEKILKKCLDIFANRNQYSDWKSLEKDSQTFSFDTVEFEEEIGELIFIAIEEVKKESFKLEQLSTIEEVRKKIKKDEGKCIQQVCYSTFHDSLTQINFTGKVIRTNLK